MGVDSPTCQQPIELICADAECGLGSTLAHGRWIGDEGGRDNERDARAVPREGDWNTQASSMKSDIVCVLASLCRQCRSCAFQAHNVRTVHSNLAPWAHKV